MHLFKQGIGGNIWKLAVEKNQTNETNATMILLKHAILWFDLNNFVDEKFSSTIVDKKISSKIVDEKFSSTIIDKKISSTICRWKCFIYQ